MTDERERKRQRTGSNTRSSSSPVTPIEVISLLDSDDDDDVVAVSSSPSGDDDDIMVVPIQAPVVVPLPGADDGGGDDDDDDDEVRAVGVVQPSALYPHARADCRTHNFEKDVTNSAHDANQKKCDKCYCYVCDDEASKCSDWVKHCMASDKKTVWRNLRTRKRAKPTAVVVVPSQALPPRLKSAASLAAEARPTSAARRRNGNIRSAFGTARLPGMGPRTQNPSLANFYGQAGPLAVANAAAAGMPGMSGPSPAKVAAGLAMHDPVAAHQLARAKQREKLLATQAAQLAKRKEQLEKERSKILPDLSKSYTFKQIVHSNQTPLPSHLKEQSKNTYLIGVCDFWRPYCSHPTVSVAGNMSSTCAELGHFLLNELDSSLTLPLKKRRGRILAKEIGLSSNDTGFIDTFHKRSAEFPEVFGKHFESSFAVDKLPLSDWGPQAIEEGISNGLITVRWELEHYQGSAGSNSDGALGCLHSCLNQDLMQEKFATTLKATLAWRKKCDERVAGVKTFDSSNCCRMRAWVSLRPHAFSSNMVRVASDVVAKNDMPQAFQIPIDAGTAAAKPPVGAWGFGPARISDTAVVGRIMQLVQFANFRNGMSLSPTSFLPKDHDNVELLKSAFRGSRETDAKTVAKFEKLYSSREALLPDSEGAAAGGQQKLFSIEGILSSPLFTVSEGYSGGSAAHPAGMNVTLRSYQLETLKWMQDQETRSISEPFWVTLTCAPLYCGKLASGSTTPSELYWYCPLTGNVSRTRPPKVCGGILAEEMGLGKTIEVISLLTETVAEARKRPVVGTGTPSNPIQCGATLIVTPVSLLKQWQKELEIRAKKEALNVCVWYGSGRPKSPRQLAKYDVLLTTYQTMASKHSKECLQGLDYYRIIIDESTYIKGGANTTMYRALMDLHSMRRWAVSGTPFGNNLSALVSIMKFLGVSPFAQESLFRPLVTHFDSRRHSSHAKADTTPGSLPVHLIPALSFLLKNIVMRHCKRQKLNGQILVELPPSSGRMIKVTLTGAERAAYDAAEKAAKSSASRRLVSEKVVNKSIIALRQLLLPVRMATTGLVRTMKVETLPNGTHKRVYTVTPTPDAAKINQLLEDVRSIREKDPVSKFIIFCEHADLKAGLCHALNAAQIGAYSLDGNMPAARRGRILVEMAEDPDRVVLVLSSAFAHGLNLVWASVVVFMEPGLSQETELQACDRVRRIGQVKATTILTYVAADTVDERICRVRTMRGHAACTGEAVPAAGGNENLPHRLRFGTYFGVDVSGEDADGAGPSNAALLGMGMMDVGGSDSEDDYW